MHRPGHSPLRIGAGDFIKFRRQDRAFGNAGRRSGVATQPPIIWAIMLEKWDQELASRDYLSRYRSLSPPLSFFVCLVFCFHRSAHSSIHQSRASSLGAIAIIIIMIRRRKSRGFDPRISVVTNPRKRICELETAGNSQSDGFA